LIQKSQKKKSNCSKFFFGGGVFFSLLFFFFLKKFNERKIKIKLLAHLFIKQKLHTSFLLFTFGQEKKRKKKTYANDGRILLGHI
jgi:hypothetical protein